MAKKKSQIDRAIEQLEADKAALDGQAAVLQAAIDRLKAQVQQQLEKATTKEGARRGTTGSAESSRTASQPEVVRTGSGS